VITREECRRMTVEELDVFRSDLFEVLDCAPNEVAGLLRCVQNGHIEGSTYVGRKCRCLVGTIAILQACDYKEIPGIVPDVFRPIEKFFYAIDGGDTPESNPLSRHVETWIMEWQANQMILNSQSENKGEV
jgi:hypothetical protein